VGLDDSGETGAPPGCEVTADDEDGDCYPKPDDCDDTDPDTHPGALDNQGTGAFSFEVILGAQPYVARTAVRLDAAQCPHVVAGSDVLTYLTLSSGEWQHREIDGRGITLGFDVAPSGELHAAQVPGSSAGPLRYLHARFGLDPWESEDLEFTVEARGTALRADSQGRPHIVYQETRSMEDPCGRDLQHLVRGPQGWLDETVMPMLPGCGVDVGLRIDADDGLHLAYNRGLSEIVDAYDIGGGWNFEGGIDDAVSYSTGATLALGPDETPYILYRYNAVEPPEARVATRTDGAWNVEAIADAQLDCFAPDTDPSGTLHAVYWDYLSEELSYVRADQDFSPLTLASSPRINGCNVAVAELGIAHVVFWNEEDELVYASNWGGADGADQNCDGVDGVDADGDGFAAKATGGLDCDDADASTRPGAEDPAGDGRDSDCDGRD
jgi:hypothetical protein